MKIGKPILIALIALLLGYFAYPFLNKVDDDVPVEDALVPDPNAQVEVTNFIGFNKYYVLTDEAIDWLGSVKSTDDSANGVVVYLGSTKSGSEQSDLLVAARVHYEDNIPGVRPSAPYYSLKPRIPIRPICPVMCDVLQDGLNIEEVPCIEGNPNDSTPIEPQDSL